MTEEEKEEIFFKGYQAGLGRAAYICDSIQSGKTGEVFSALSDCHRLITTEMEQNKP